MRPGFGSLSFAGTERSKKKREPMEGPRLYSVGMEPPPISCLTQLTRDHKHIGTVWQEQKSGSRRRCYARCKVIRHLRGSVGCTAAIVEFVTRIACWTLTTTVTKPGASSSVAEPHE